MNLTVEQILSLIKEPKNKAHLDRAVEDNRWQEFHAKPSTSEDEVKHYDKFMDRVRCILDETKKSAIFEKLLSFPLPSTKLISKASDEWNKIFTAQDRNIEYYFEKEEYQSDFRDYLDGIGVQDIVEQQIFTAAKQSINTFVVVDFPSDYIDYVNEGMLEERDGIGEAIYNRNTGGDSSNFVSPFVYLLDVSFVIDADEDENGNIEYIIFNAGTAKDRKIIAIDDSYFRIFNGLDDRNPIENLHGLGFCPVRTIWSDNIASDIPIRRFNSVTEVLSDLDEYVQYHVFQRHTHLYAGFPILTRYVSRCEYVDIDKNPCIGGVINFIDPISGAAKVMDCPACSKGNGLLGPGSLANIPLPTDKEAPPVPDNIIEFVTPPQTILDYNKNIVKEKEAAIMHSLTGGEMKVTDNEAVNEDQVRSQYEKKQDILVYWAENMQKIHKFIVDTIGKARYGDKYKGSTINYGYNFFLIDMNIAVKEYTDAVNAGLPQYIVAEKRAAVEAIYVRRSPERAYRIQLLRMLEPCLDISIDKIPGESLDYALKSNFSKYIDLFEAEYGPITQVGLSGSLTERVRMIQKQLYKYVKEDTEQRQSFIREFGQTEEVPATGEDAKRGGSTPVQGNKDRLKGDRNPKQR